jgi:3-deoxy-D-manno-octulosonic-acid transferase
MKIIIKIVYSYILLPLAVIVFGLFSLFKAKYRKSFIERFYVISKLQSYLKLKRESNKYILIHCASMGEFEHIKPLIAKLSEYPSRGIILTFFSPSGYEHIVKFNGVDLILYLPFDFPGLWRRFYQHLNPVFIIISKHDAWPNQIWIANEHNIPVFLVNASLNEKSSRVKGSARILFNEVYKAFDQIYAISESDMKNFETYFKNVNVKTIGDTKFDQVVLRKKQAENTIHIPDNWISDNLVIIFGSIWPEDLIHLKTPIKNILARYKFIKIIIVPHQPDDNQINEIKSFLTEESTTLFTNNSFPNDKRALIINTVGVLADLYKYADIAYVGGSFKQGIHNVMEPAIYGIPVVYGPQHKNSHDAIHLLKREGALQILNHDQALYTFNKLIEDKKYRNKLGKNALDFALSNTGVSEKLIQQWLKYLK